MPVLALVLYAAYVLLAFGLRSLLQRRRTGSAGFHGVSGRPGSAEWLGGVGFVVALVLGFLAPVLALVGVAEADALSAPAGVTLAVAGIACALLAQHAMGTSWRIGVEEAERTALVTHGIFAAVRNPFFTASLAVPAGLVLLVPNVVAFAAFALLLLAVEVQVRVVEEPYLLRAQGEGYARYAAKTGRFVPGVGRLV